MANLHKLKMNQHLATANVALRVFNYEKFAGGRARGFSALIKMADEFISDAETAMITGA